MADDVTWLTYAELADALGIGGDSARNLVRRKRWQRKPGNDGLTRIGVPVEHIADRPKLDVPISPPTEGEVRPPIDPPTHAPIGAEALAVLSRHIEHLGAELKEARTKLDESQMRIVQLTAEAAVSSALRETVAALKSALDMDKAQLSEVRADRDRWRQEATAPRGFFRWWSRSA